MDIKHKIEELKKLYDYGNFKVFFTEDCEHITHIDFENNIVFYFVYVSDVCGCCSITEDREMDLEMFISYLSEDDYNSLLLDLKNN